MVKWYVNGVEDTSKENQLTVTFDRPSGDTVQVYTFKAIDLTGTIIALMMFPIIQIFMKVYSNRIFIGELSKMVVGIAILIHQHILNMM